jgi:hypothetical protein
MLYWITLVMCLAGHPSDCMDVPVDEPAHGPQECALDGQEAGADWVLQNPGWSLSVVKCTPGKEPPPHQQDL